MQPNGIAVPVPPIRTQVSGGVLDLGTLEFNDVIRDIDQITIYFSSMDITEVYTIQSVVAAEIKVHKHALAKQV